MPRDLFSWRSCCCSSSCLGTEHGAIGRLDWHIPHLPIGPPKYPGCNTTKTGMQHHKQRQEGVIDVFETAKLMAAAAMWERIMAATINVSNHLSEVPCGQRANKCILGSEIHTTLDLVRQFYSPIIIGCISIFRVCDGRILISHIQIHFFPHPTL